ncbi:molybdate transport system substrate-binding protein [Deinobacterium chartae]|uniref:Molybdate transport system substrate-binding protein n=1 Tax=Deinobacterium chartae TaxID=521158 RepID=A0A841I3H9_9DEIO|nr:molybdate ABC transporter substrate-binding protein [Deinobacterium chartae]MBB6099863.1 molybdate transport system substrate-binding protein [Deinobacterium chartae]
MKNVLILLLLVCGSAQAVTVRAAVAANLRDAFARLEAAFERAHPGVNVEAVYTSSGAAVTQIRQGAPFDLFLAADTDFARELVRSGHAVPGSLRPYARGKLVLWISRRHGVQPRGLEVLQDPRLTRVALASPETAPYGRSALEALRRAGLLEQLRSKLVYGADIGITAQQALIGTGAGFIPYAYALTPAFARAGSYWALPQRLYPPLDQAMVIVKGRDGPPVRALYHFVLSEAGQGILRASGYTVPGR